MAESTDRIEKDIDLLNKDLEPLARRVRKLGGTVEVTASGHVK